MRNILEMQKEISLPSHRELLFQDLLNLGATKKMILTTPESSITKKIRQESYNILTNFLNDKYSQVGIVTFLRFWAEVFVSIEYSCLWHRISEKLNNDKSNIRNRSEF